MENGFLTAFLSSHLFHFCGVTTILFKARVVGYLLWCEEQGRAKPEHCCRTESGSRGQRTVLQGQHSQSSAVAMWRACAACTDLTLSPSMTNMTNNGWAKESGCFRNADGRGCLLLVCTIFLGSIMAIFCVYWKNLFIFICDFVYSYGKSITIFLLLFYCLCKLQLKRKQWSLITYFFCQPSSQAGLTAHLYTMDSHNLFTDDNN